MIPAARFRLATVGHWTPGGALGTGEQQAEVTTHDVSEGWRGVMAKLEAEVAGAEVNRLVDVIDHVADTNQVLAAHHHAPFVQEFRLQKAYPGPASFQTAESRTMLRASTHLRKAMQPLP